jgi:hypothetical protein
VFLQFFNFYVIRVDQTVRLDPLRARFIVEVVVTFEPLVPLDGLLELKLYFGVLGLEVQRYFIYSFGG